MESDVGPPFAYQVINSFGSQFQSTSMTLNYIQEVIKILYQITWCLYWTLL